MKIKLRLHTLVAALLFTLFAAPLTTFADPPSESRYEVTRKGAQVATVTTSASRDAVLVSIHRPGQPTHHYRAYPQVAAVTVQIDRRQVFTYYMELGRVDVKQFSVASGRVADESFSINLAEVSGPARRARAGVEAVRLRFEEDMRVLRAVRAYDPSADVRLAELAYVVLTHDDSIMDGKAPAGFAVSGGTTKPPKQPIQP